MWGNELNGPDNVSPIEAGYGGFVKLHKPFFIGRDEMVRGVLNMEREILRFKIDKKGARVVRKGNLIATKDGDVIGHVTSNVVAGTIQVGLALVERRRVKDGDLIHLCLSHMAIEEDIEASKKERKLKPGLTIETGVVLPRFPPRADGKTGWHSMTPELPVVPPETATATPA